MGLTPYQPWPSTRHVRSERTVFASVTGKPDPSRPLNASRQLGTRPERIAYVGDELDLDALGA